MSIASAATVSFFSSLTGKVKASASTATDPSSFATALVGDVASAAATAATSAVGASSSSALTASPTSARKSPADEFMKWAGMTAAERMRASILGNMGLDEDKVKAMGAKDRKAVEDKIAALIKQDFQTRTGKTAGAVADIKA